MYENFLFNQAQKSGLNPIKFLMLGTCSAGALIDPDLLSSQQIKVDHLLFDGSSYANFPRDYSEYAAVIISLTERYIISQAAGTPNEFLFHRLGDDNERGKLLSAASEDISKQMAQIIEYFNGTPIIFLSLLEPVANLNGLLTRRFSLSNPKYFIQKLNEHIEQICFTNPSTYYFEINEISNSIGAFLINDQIFASTFHGSYLNDSNLNWDRDRIVETKPLREIFNYEEKFKLFKIVFWRSIRDALEILRNPLAIKLIIVDLDDTMWRGVAADDNLSIEERIEGWPIGFAESLLYFKRRGGLLAIASKNSEDVTKRRFEEIYGNRLTLDDFASVKIGWGRKSEYIEQILNEINLLSKNVAYIDDNPREINEVVSKFPDIVTLGFQQYLWRSSILFDPSFQIAALTYEGVRRTELVRASVARKLESNAQSNEEWLESLSIELTISLCTNGLDNNFQRIFELLNKTNQFNTTGKRWELAEIQKFLGRGGKAYWIKMRDRFADNGLIGVMLVENNLILQAVLSCRAFNLGIEHSFLSMVCEDLLRSYSEVKADFIDTGKNFTCQNFFHDNGFSFDDGLWKTCNTPSSPRWIYTIKLL